MAVVEMGSTMTVCWINNASSGLTNKVLSFRELSE